MGFLTHGQADIGDLTVKVPAGRLDLDTHNLERGEFALAKFVLNRRPNTAPHLVTMRDKVAAKNYVYHFDHQVATRGR